MSEAGGIPVLSVRDLRVTFAGEDAPVEAVRGIDFDLFPKEILAIVGESGSGKSATALAIPGLLPGDAAVSGEIALKDKGNLLSLGRRELAALRGRQIAMIFQDPAAALDPVFSIGYQLDEAIRLHEPGLSRPLRRSRAVALLQQVGIDRAESRLARYPHELSGGQLQRVMIAIALAGRPQVLIADEPTTALDVTVQQEILDLLYRLNRDEGMAVLLITHDMGVVADIARRVIVLHRGLVVETAPVETLFAAPREDYTRRLLAAVPGGQASATLVGERRDLLKVHDLRLGYASGFGNVTEVVKGVSFDIGVGEFLGLVGESGSGKTTIGRSLLGLVRPLSGTVRLEGRDLHDRRSHDAAWPATRIGAVFQSPGGSLNPRLTIGQSVAEPIRAHTKLSHAAVDKQVADMLDQVGLPAAWRNRFPRELSGGQRQRVAIARALALEPVLLIADEPTSALDLSVQAGILDLLRTLQRDHHFACLFISHDLAVVRSLCQSVLVLQQGETVESGTTAQVLSHPQTDYARGLVASAPLPNPHLQALRRASRTNEIRGS